MAEWGPRWAGVGRSAGQLEVVLARAGRWLWRFPISPGNGPEKALKEGDPLNYLDRRLCRLFRARPENCQFQIGVVCLFKLIINWVFMSGFGNPEGKYSHRHKMYHAPSCSSFLTWT